MQSVRINRLTGAAVCAVLLSLGIGAPIARGDSYFWTGRSASGQWDHSETTLILSMDFGLSGIVGASQGSNQVTRYTNWFVPTTPTSTTGSFATSKPGIDDDIVFGNALNASHSITPAENPYVGARSMQIVSTTDWSLNADLGLAISPDGWLARWPDAAGNQRLTAERLVIKNTWVGGSGSLIYQATEFKSGNDETFEKHGPGRLVIEVQGSDGVWDGLVVRSGRVDITSADGMFKTISSGDSPNNVLTIGETSSAAVFPTNLPYPGYIGLPLSFPTIAPAVVRIEPLVNIRGTKPTVVHSDGTLELIAPLNTLDTVINNIRLSGDGLVKVFGGVGKLVVQTDSSAEPDFTGTIEVRDGAVLGSAYSGLSGNIHVYQGSAISLESPRSFNGPLTNITMHSGSALRQMPGGRSDLASLYVPADVADLSGLPGVEVRNLTIERNNIPVTNQLTAFSINGEFYSKYAGSGPDAPVTVGTLSVTDGGSTSIRVDAGTLGTATAVRVNLLRYTSDFTRLTKLGLGTLDIVDATLDGTLRVNLLDVNEGRVNLGQTNIPQFIKLAGSSYLRFDRALNPNPRTMTGLLEGTSSVGIDVNVDLQLHGADNSIAANINVTDSKLTLASLSNGVPNAHVVLRAPQAGQGVATLQVNGQKAVKNLTSTNGAVVLSEGAVLTLATFDNAVAPSFIGSTTALGNDAKIVFTAGTSTTPRTWKGPAGDNVDFQVNSGVTLNSRSDTMSGVRDLTINGTLNIETLASPVTTATPTITGMGTINYTGPGTTIFSGSTSATNNLVIKEGVVDFRATGGSALSAGSLSAPVVVEGPALARFTGQNYQNDFGVDYDVAGTLQLNGTIQRFGDLTLRSGAGLTTPSLAGSAPGLLVVEGNLNTLGFNGITANVDVRGSILAPTGDAMFMNLAGKVNDMLLLNQVFLGVGGIVPQGKLELNGDSFFAVSPTFNFFTDSAADPALIDLNGELSGMGTNLMNVSLTINRPTTYGEVIRLIDFTDSPTNLMLSQFSLQNVIGAPANGGLSIDGRTLVFTVIPEPGTVALIVSVTLVMLGRRRRSVSDQRQCA